MGLMKVGCYAMLVERCGRLKDEKLKNQIEEGTWFDGQDVEERSE